MDKTLRIGKIKGFVIDTGEQRLIVAEFLNVLIGLTQHTTRCGHSPG